MKRKANDASMAESCAAVAIAGTIIYFATPILIAVKNRIKRKLIRSDIKRLTHQLAWAISTAAEPWYVTTIRNQINDLKKELQ